MRQRCEMCGLEFVAERPGRKFCSHSCSNKRPKPKTSHKYHPLHSIWRGMIRRCHTETKLARHYKNRGIYVCDRWRFGDGGLDGFKCFVSDVGERPSALHSIDRVDNDGPYSPDNCRWSTPTQQQRNKSDNRIVAAYGREMTVAELAELSGLRHGLVRLRVSRGWNPETAASTPPRRHQSA